MFHFSPSHSIRQKMNEHDKLDKQGWNYFTCYFYPAAGPQCLNMMGFLSKLRKTFDTEKKEQNKRKWLIRGSMGALCFSSLITSIHTNKSYTDQPRKLKDAFIQMSYHPKMGIDGGRKALGTMMNNLFEIAAPDPEFIIEHPQCHIIIIIIVRTL